MEQNIFEKCLRDLESGNTKLRRRGMQRLSTLSDPRVLQVSKALRADEDETIRFYAFQIYNRLIDDGVSSRVKVKTEIKTELEYLHSPTQVLDEVLFIFKSNLRRITVVSLKTGLIKIVLAVGIIIFFSWGFDDARGQLFKWKDLLSLRYAAAIFMYHLFLRPVTWDMVGRAFLGGYRDRTARALAKRGFTAERYSEMLKANILKSLLVPGIPFIMFIISQETPMLVFGLIISILVLYKTTHMLPRYLLTDPSPAHRNKGIGMFSPFGGLARRLYPTFLVVSAGFYLCIGYGLMLSMEIFVHNPIPLEQIVLLLVADILIDPFWIGFHILVTRCVMQMKEENRATTAP